MRKKDGHRSANGGLDRSLVIRVQKSVSERKRVANILACCDTALDLIAFNQLLRPPDALPHLEVLRFCDARGERVPSALSRRIGAHEKKCASVNFSKFGDFFRPLERIENVRRPNEGLIVALRV